MIVTTKCATRLKNLETTRLPRNIFGRLTAYILISRQIFFKNSQRSSVNSKTRKPPFWLLRDLAFKRWNLFPGDKSIKTQKHFGCHATWHPKKWLWGRLKKSYLTFKKRSSRRNNNNNNRLERLFISFALFVCLFFFRINYFNQSSIIIITSINEILRSFFSTENNV